MSKVKWKWCATVSAILLAVHIATGSIVGLFVGVPGLMIALYFSVRDDDDDSTDYLGV